jgi:hypothetical protein
MSRRQIAIAFVTLLVAALLAVPIYVGWIYTVEVPRIMGDFAALWNTADALRAHILSGSNWPTDWKELDRGLRFVNADPSLAEELVVINFDVDIEAPQSDEQWYVRLKSGRMLPEQDSANNRIRQCIEFLQKKSADENAISADGPAQSFDPPSNRSAAMRALP